ncbi:hypothetical protein [Agrococcus carbonis]|uniref:Uncharacterized protein n=1 Tax=Agrococcus carbonis TaxID=684552 RepID=A0A1H1QCD6_9MICO|nr:hypothetical protein [Agrococcus carbonis]SDS21178.1 hypothetical protein SAMN04489719_1801 [Agrococcus carbonis]
MKPHARAAAPVALLVAAVLLAGCSGATPDPSTDPSIPPGITAPPPTQPATPTPEAPEVESSLPAEIAGVDTSDWQQIPTPSGAATFRIPADWTTREADGGLDLLRADGQRQLLYRESPDTGDGACRDASGAAVGWRTSLLERSDVSLEGASGIAFGAAAVQLGQQWVMSVGLRPAPDAQTPRCPIVNAFDSAAGTIAFGSEVVVQGAGDASAWQVASFGDAEAYLGDPEYRTIRAILMSLELQQ